jgi:hypothetical protein
MLILAIDKIITNQTRRVRGSGDAIASDLIPVSGGVRAV